jgi:signal transduction histidine kinase
MRADAPSVRGIPFSRSYSFEDIGHVPRGSRLGFDQFGRLSVIHETIYTVLNDSTWLDLAGQDVQERVPLICAGQAPDGHHYYGARGSWGYTELGSDGRLHPVSLVPPHPPAWIATAAFSNILVTDAGVYFPSWNGVVFWNPKTQKNLLFEIPRLSSAFRVGNRVYISAYETPLRYVDLASETLKSAAGTALDDNVVEQSAPLNGSSSLVTLADGRLLVYDGKTVSPWLAPEDNSIKGHISTLQQIVDGHIAIAVTGQGLLLFSKEGQLLMALTASQYHNITALANREPGVLWIETEDTVEKILYSSPLSAFKQRLGLPIAWPIIVSWNQQLYVASGGKLYRAAVGKGAEPTRFELCSQQPPGGAWALAAWGPHMLIGNGTGLYSAEHDGSYLPLKSVGNLGQLVMYDENHCYLIGRAEIALIEWQDGRWVETVPRIPGVADPAIVHRVGQSVWIEMGGGGVAHLRLREGRLLLDAIPNDPWTKATWVNVGVVDDIVVLTARPDEPRRFYDEKRGDWCTAPALDRLLSRSPYWILRVYKDESGVIWASHNEGLVRFAPRGRGYDMDTSNFDLVNDRYPLARVLPHNDVWVLAARALYHVEKGWLSPAVRSPRPILVSLFDSQNNEELLGALGSAESKSPRFPYTKNNLSFRFFSGTDGWRRAPIYEYRLSAHEPWTTLDGSLLNFRGLHEGIYNLQVRVAGALETSEASSTIAFAILPPWHRTWLAYLLFGALFIAILLGVAHWTNILERRRNRKLAGLVTERTRQLETAMAKLGDETRKAATLAERDRLANEIHDSVQQGLTGAILQLDTTLKLPAIGQDVRSRLDVVRNMVSYARQEVQHAVWDMESPLLEGADLADALRNLTTFVDSDGVVIDVSVTGEPRPLTRSINHNLLRVAQEAATNALRHAQAKRIDIQLCFTPANVALEISDDGVGFVLDEVLREKTGHLGLRGIQARAKKLQGTLTVNSAKGQGAVIRIDVPTTNQREQI